MELQQLVIMPSYLEPVYPYYLSSATNKVHNMQRKILQRAQVSQNRNAHGRITCILSGQLHN